MNDKREFDINKIVTNTARAIAGVKFVAKRVAIAAHTSAGR